MRWLLSLSTACLLLVGCAERLPPPARGAPGTSVDPTSADAARVVCAPDGIHLEDPVVRAQRDGVHVTVENPGDAWAVDLHPEPSPYGFAAEIQLTNGTTRYVSAIGPGRVTVACVPTSRTFYDDPGIQTDTLTIVDPRGLYVPWNLACGSGDQFRTKIEASPDEDPLSVVRRLPGVLATDDVDRPKYPGSARYSPIESVVLRDGDVIVRVPLGSYEDGAWHVLVNACPGTGVHA